MLVMSFEDVTPFAGLIGPRECLNNSAPCNSDSFRRYVFSFDHHRRSLRQRHRLNWPEDAVLENRADRAHGGGPKFLTEFDRCWNIPHDEASVPLATTPSLPHEHPARELRVLSVELIEQRS